MRVDAAKLGGLHAQDGRVANIFVSYTSSDRDWAFWIGHELEALGHSAHIHDWEISGGGNIVAWMEERFPRQGRNSASRSLRWPRRGRSGAASPRTSRSRDDCG